MQSKFLLILTILIVPCVYAAYTETLHDGWHYSNESFKAGSLNINLTGSSLQDSVMLDYGEQRLLLKNKTCEETAKYFFCVDSTREGNFDYYWRYWRLQYKIEIKQKLAKLELTRVISKTNLFPNQDSQITLTVKNTGSFAATDLHLEDPFPNFAIVNSNNCLAAEHALVWDGSLMPNEQFSCAYTIRALANISLRSKATATYFNGKAAATDSSAESVVTVSGNEIKWNAPSFINLEIGQSNKIVVNLNNTLPADITVNSLTFSIPYGLRIIEFHTWNKVNDYKLQYSTSLESKGARTLDATLTAERTRRFILPLNLEYKVEATTKVAQKNITIDVSLPNLSIIYNLAKNWTAGKTARIVVSIKNPSNIQTFRQVDTKLEIPCFNINLARKFQEIVPAQTLDIYSEVIDVPNNTKSCAIKTTIGYDTTFGQHISLYKNMNVSVIYASVAALTRQLTAATNASTTLEQKQNIQETSATSRKKSLIIPLIAGAAILVILLAIFLMRKRKRGLISKQEATVVQKELNEVKKESPFKKQEAEPKRATKRKKAAKKVVEKEKQQQEHIEKPVEEKEGPKSKEKKEKAVEEAEDSEVQPLETGDEEATKQKLSKKEKESSVKDTPTFRF